MRSNFENLRVYQLAERVSDLIWDLVLEWDWFARDTVGKQLVRAADSVGANIAEGNGRGSYADHRRFIRTARGSLNETRHFLRRAYRRKLLKKSDIHALKTLLDELSPKLNSFLNSIGPRSSTALPAKTRRATPTKPEPPPEQPATHD